MSKNNAFELEWQNTLRVLSEKNAHLMELEYFSELAKGYSSFYLNDSTPKVVLLGYYFPEEIIRAMGIEFCHVFGGSSESALSPDVNLPKDADDEARSVVGILKSDRLNLSKNDVVLIPLCNDNMKKLKPIVDDLATVVCYEVPSDKEDPLQKSRFLSEIERVTAELKKHFEKKLSSRKLREQCDISKQSAAVFGKLEKLYKENEAELSPSAFMFIANSYRMCGDKAEWAVRLERLVCQLEAGKKPSLNSYPKIMLFGSPIYAPNFKILFAVEESKLRLNSIIHPDIEHLKMLLDIESRSASVEYLAGKYLDADISSVYVKDSAVNGLVTEEIKSGEIKGALAHIIKGQIGYDYAFKYIEGSSADFKTPLNRIETVYTNHDIEQIRIRLEAFAEMLSV